jgi:hypothetical protein
MCVYWCACVTRGNACRTGAQYQVLRPAVMYVCVCVCIRDKRRCMQD